jgi:hypothetical protein
MVPLDDANPTTGQQIPLLEKFVNKIGVNFEELELEMQQRLETENMSHPFGGNNGNEDEMISFDQDAANNHY